MLFKIGTPKNFAIFTGKHLRCSLVRTLSPATLLKKRLQHSCLKAIISKKFFTAFFPNWCCRSFNPIQYKPFRSCSWIRVGEGKDRLPKIYRTYPTMMNLGTVVPYLKKIQKIYKSCDTTLESCWHQHFFTANQQILLYQEIQIQTVLWYIISNSFNLWLF